MTNHVRTSADPLPNPPPAYRERGRARRAFTLVELLVVIGIIALLIGILLPALNAARLQARFIKASSDVRQLMVAYTAYHTDNKGWLLFGYPTQAVNGHELRAIDPVTNVSLDYATLGFFSGLIADRYPWRLASYFPGIWPAMYGSGQMPSLTRKGDSVATVQSKAYNLSVSADIGINAVYVGGTKAMPYPSFVQSGLTLPVGGTITNGVPIPGKHCVFRAGEVKNTGRLLVFAESQSPLSTGPGDPAQGLPYLMPPRAAGKQFWDVGPKEKIKWTDAGGFLAGLPQGRYGDRTVCGIFDGHVEALRPSELADMRWWCVRADSPDFNYAP